MNDINKSYEGILTKYGIETRYNSTYKQELKSLLMERLTNIKFVKKLKRNSPEMIEVENTVSEAVALYKTMNTGDKVINEVKSAAASLRKAMIEEENWSILQSSGTYKTPQLLTYFVTELLFGKHASTVAGKRSDEVEKVVATSCQILQTNLHSDRQVSYQPKSDMVFRSRKMSPLTFNLPLAFHARHRDKVLVETLNHAYVGCSYKAILDYEADLEQAVLERMATGPGICIPDFVKKDVNIWFAIDNIDFLEDTPSGQGTFHGTVIVAFQRVVPGDPVNPPLVIKHCDKSKPRYYMNIDYLQAPVIKISPIRFKTFKLNQSSKLSTYTGVWQLCSHLSYATSCNLEDQPDKEE